MQAVWRLAYRAAARGYGAYVTRGEPGASAYVRGTLASGEALAGLADIDVDVVVESADARRRVRERFRRAQRALPVVGELLFDWPSVFTRDELERTATQTAFTYGLDASPPAAAYLGHAADPQRARLLERPELYGPAHAWRRVAGPARPLPAAPRHPDTRRLVTWLELQNWWRWAFEACARPDRPWVGQLCVKLVADPFRAWCWLVDGDRIAGRVEALERGRERLPELAPAFERALRLHASLRAMPEPPLASALADLLALSELIAREVARQVEPAGVTDVRLVDPRPRCFAFAHGGWSGGGRLFPLVDWHALVAGRGEPDEAFAIVDGDPREPAVLSELASARDRGPYPTLRHGELMLRPSTMGGRLNLRSVQCPAADPVSFALAEGRAVASFPNVPG